MMTQKAFTFFPHSSLFLSPFSQSDSDLMNSTLRRFPVVAGTFLFKNGEEGEKEAGGYGWAMDLSRLQSLHSIPHDGRKDTRSRD